MMISSSTIINDCAEFENIIASLIVIIYNPFDIHLKISVSELQLMYPLDSM